MTILNTIFCLIGISALAFFACHETIQLKERHSKFKSHSLRIHHSFFGFIVTLFIPLLALIFWSAALPQYLENIFLEKVAQHQITNKNDQMLVYRDVMDVAHALNASIANGKIPAEAAFKLDPLSADFKDLIADEGVTLATQLTQELLTTAQEFSTAYDSAVAWRSYTIIGLAFVSLGFALLLIKPSFRARHVTEFVTKLFLIFASGIAIFTTIGIVLSMFFETWRFFSLYAPMNFFFGLHWAPNFRGDSALGLLPLLWGTLYISVVALIVAVPIGLYAAIYLSEYASKSVRAIAKPLLEVLAGVPTIVYGLFALLTFGPFLRGLFAEGGVLGVTWMGDARSVLTAGVVMGIMLIPFVSSLSDDIINAVPQSLRDGSYGLGATQSETIRQVILPAALPGVVGAILLAASRAIGETMIVVLGAGAIARFSGNPLEALTTVTTRIVSQLTGDGDFNSPETLVAFALGLTLFIITLALNYLALRIVRRYREQYE